MAALNSTEDLLDQQAEDIRKLEAENERLRAILAESHNAMTNWHKLDEEARGIAIWNAGDALGYNNEQSPPREHPYVENATEFSGEKP